MADRDTNRDLEPEPISEQLDALVCAMIDYALDLLGETAELPVTLATEDAAGNQSMLCFDDEEIEQCLEEARSKVRGSRRNWIEGLTGRAERYALAYDGAVETVEGAGYEPALIVEYGERGMTQAYSAYLIYRNAGNPQEFMWTDPEAAGVEELLVQGL